MRSCESQARAMSGSAKDISEEEIAKILSMLPPLHIVCGGEAKVCGVRFVRGGMEAVCCRTGKAEYSTLASDPRDDKVYQSAKCYHHRGTTDQVYAVQAPAILECEALGPDGEPSIVGFASGKTLDLVERLPKEIQYKICFQPDFMKGAAILDYELFDFASLRYEHDEQLVGSFDL